MTTLVSASIKTIDRAQKEKTNTNDKAFKKLPVGFAEDAEKMNEEELRNVIVESNNNIRRVKEEMEGDEKLQGAKSIVSDLMGPYNDAKKAQQAKIDFCLSLLSEKGLLQDG